MNFTTGRPTYGGAMPPMAFNYRHPPTTDPRQPQNLMRPTAKGCGGRCGGSCGPCGNKLTGSGFGKSLGVMGLGGLKAVGDAYDAGQVPLGVWIAYSVLSAVGAISGAYHGYKRNDSAGWAVAWFFFGSWLPLLSIPISLAQGFGKRAKKG